MSAASGDDRFRGTAAEQRLPPAYESRHVFGAFWGILFVATFLVSGPWAGFHAILLGSVGLLVAWKPPVCSLPRFWWMLAAVFMVAGSLSFLPAGAIPQPSWRAGLEALGVRTGPLIAIQARQAAEGFVLFLITLFVGMWLAGHRSSKDQLRIWSLVFTLGVAVYAIVSRIMQAKVLQNGDAHFGFFPNRNHSATYLAMGAVCGLGCVLQAARDKRFLALSAALAATGVCLWAVAAWSVSRAGVVLVAAGCLLWIPMLGRRYLGRNGLWGIGLILLAALGLFLVGESNVKQRLIDSVGKVDAAINPADPVGPKPALDSSGKVDFRIPTALDTLRLIHDFKWTGIGASQFYHVFPQYRHLTAVAADSDSYHPESDWLWMASETGVPATLALAVLVVLAFARSRIGILQGRDRALRSACLVAALLVPFHGVFDVPGHRITLAWSAVLLFSLASNGPFTKAVPIAPRVWPFRLLAAVVVGISLWLARAQWWNGPQPATTVASHALDRARELYEEDKAFQQAAAHAGMPYQPSPSEDRLEKALTLLQQASAIAPLDRDLLRYQAFLAFSFDDKYDLIDRTFAIDRALDPTWVAGPLIQAQGWSKIAPEKTVLLWKEALRRARNLDRLQPNNHWGAEKTMERIRGFAKGNPVLEARLQDLE